MPLLPTDNIQINRLHSNPNNPITQSTIDVAC